MKRDRVDLLMEKDLKAGLIEQANKRDITFSEYVREVLKEHLNTLKLAEVDDDFF